MSNGYIKQNDRAEQNYQVSSTFSVNNSGVLSIVSGAQGAIYSADVRVPFAPFAPSTYIRSIATYWKVENRTLKWLNDAFFGGSAVFCLQNDTGSLAYFTVQPPDDCQRIQFSTEPGKYKLMVLQIVLTNEVNACPGYLGDNSSVSGTNSSSQIPSPPAATIKPTGESTFSPATHSSPTSPKVSVSPSNTTKPSVKPPSPSNGSTGDDCTFNGFGSWTQFYNGSGKALGPSDARSYDHPMESVDFTDSKMIDCLAIKDCVDRAVSKGYSTINVFEEVSSSTADCQACSTVADCSACDSVITCEAHYGFTSNASNYSIRGAENLAKLRLLLAWRE